MSAFKPKAFDAIVASVLCEGRRESDGEIECISENLVAIILKADKSGAGVALRTGAVGMFGIMMRECRFDVCFAGRALTPQFEQQCTEKGSVVAVDLGGVAPLKDRIKRQLTLRSLHRSRKRRLARCCFDVEGREGRLLEGDCSVARLADGSWDSSRSSRRNRKRRTRLI